ncbi:MAG: hypothetical protein H0V24_08140 [Chloroflexia bacterium]|nr:hypothetical protein [Chloroflexia bacterium]
MKLLQRLMGLVGILLVAGAVINEFGKEPEKRTGHGTVADIVPYDFRLPTRERLLATFWNPDGPVIVNTALGVGWTVNFGRLARLIGMA